MMQIVIPIVLLLGGIGVLILIARELDQVKKRKLAGILFALLCILFIISQLSYLLYPTTRYKNFGGLFGFCMSQWSFWLVGFYFLIIPALFAYLGYVFLLKTDKPISIRLLFFIPVGIIVDTMLSLFLKLTIAGISAGGTLGTLICTFLLNYFGHIGTYFILLFGTVIILFMVVREKIWTRRKVFVSDIKQKPVIPRKEKKKKPVLKEEKTTTTIPRHRDVPEIDFRTEFLTILQEPTDEYGVDKATLQQEAEVLTNRLAEFDVAGKVVGIESGPVISRFEFQPAPGVKVNRISNLDNDLALALKATRIRVVAPIPGKSAVGIEVPNKERSLVFLKKGLVDDDFSKKRSPLGIVLGEDITGSPVNDDISTMPHMLIAGTTGSGKSVCINTKTCVF
jgi:S-DNA-T family DNA segregation ATPase FtsK/SpoIIIE